ncbi:MAG: DUF6252 family protein [Gemmatimonadaceae bacterium]
MKRLAFLALMLATVTVAACGDDGGNPPVGAGRMSASIDGTAFTGSLAVTAVRTTNTITIAGVGSNTRQISINLLGVTTTGAVAVGVGSQNFAQYSQGTQTWVSSLAGGSGTVNLTTLSATHATGTFSFTGIGSTSTGASGNKVVSSGTFDVNF